MSNARIDSSTFTDARAHESGTTVIELMITTAILLVITASLFSLMINLSKADVRTGALANNADVVRVTEEKVARDIRASNPLLATDGVTGHTISADEVIVTIGPTAGPQTVVAWRYDSAAHTLSRCTRASAGVSVTCSAVLTKVDVASAAPVFRYYCTSGAELDPAKANGPADIAKVGVRIRITLDAAPNNGPAALPIQTDAELRNQPGATGC